jgi:hypothetical protein
MRPCGRCCNGSCCSIYSLLESNRLVAKLVDSVDESRYNRRFALSFDITGTILNAYIA